MQLPTPGTIEILAKTIGAPALTFFLFVVVFRKLLIPRANGKAIETQTATLEETIKELSKEQTRDILYKLDSDITGHFDQLRRDLEMKITIGQGQTEKAIDNSITAFLFRQELNRRETPR